MLVETLMAVMVLMLAVVGVWVVAVAMIEDYRDRKQQAKEWANREFRPMAEMHRY